MAVSELAQRVLSGENPGLRKLAAEGVLPLPQEELLALQVRLTEVDDPDIAAAAENSLKNTDPRFVLALLNGEVETDVLRWFSENSVASAVLETIVQRRDIDLEIVRDLARRGQPSVQEVLLLRQDLIIQHPDILEDLETNGSLSSYSKRRIDEYRLHLLEKEKVDEPEEEPAESAEDEIENDEELEQAIEQVLAEVEPEGEIDERTGLSEGQVRSMPTPLRVKLSRGASRSLRGILLRDQNPQVATAVLTGSAVGESEIEAISANRQVVEEVLLAISQRREWSRKYVITHNLVKNPRTPVGIAVRMTSRLSVRDLNLLKGDRGVSDAVRQTAKRIHSAKNK